MPFSIPYAYLQRGSIGICAITEAICGICTITERNYRHLMVRGGFLGFEEGVFMEDIHLSDQDSSSVKV